MVKLSPCNPALSDGGPTRRVHSDPFHVGQVNYHSPVANRVSGHVVTPTPDRDQHSVLPGELHCLNHVSRASRPNYEGRVSVNHSIPNLSGLIIIPVAGKN